MNAVYLSYDGALDPLGRSQVVPVVEGLARGGISMRLVTFEKREKWRDGDSRRAMKHRLDEAGVAWTALRYHRRFSVAATIWDLSRALVLVVLWRVRRRCDLVHARSYPPALVAWGTWRLFGVPFVFDMRGLYPDERVDAGLWSAGSRRYRLTKALEKRFLRNAEEVVTLTRASVPVIRAIEKDAGGGPEPVVIPTCVDLDLFSCKERGPGGPPTLAYFGSVAGWYLIDRMLAFGKVYLETVPGSRLLFLVNDPVGAGTGEAVQSLIRNADQHGVDIARLDTGCIPHEEVPAALDPAIATFAFIDPLPSKVASSATKISESWALGIPVAVNPAVGDAAAVVDAEGVGVVVDPFEPSGWPAAASLLAELARSPDIRARCRSVAERAHSVASAVACYRELYDSIGGATSERPAAT